MNKTSRLLLALFLSLAPTACAAKVIGGGGTGAGSPDDPGTGGEPVVGTGGGAGGTGGEPFSCGSGGGAPSAAPSAIALLASQIDWNVGAGGGGTSSSTTGGDGVPPNTLYLMIGSPVPSCSSPFTSTSVCGPTFAVYLGIPAELQQPGTIALSGINASFSESGPPNSPTPGDCPFGGGSFTDGTIEIVSIDATQVVFTLSGTMMLTDEGVSDEIANGTYTAPRCP